MSKNLYVGNLAYGTTADDLREALTALLRSEASDLPVRDADGSMVGRLSLEALRRVSRPGGAP